MKKLLSLILALTLLLTVLSGCSEDIANEALTTDEVITPSQGQTTDQKFSNPDGDTWTVLVYLCGTDLETNGAFATTNLQEMSLAAQSENVNVLVQTGGTKQWAIDSIDSSKLQRWQVIPESIELKDSQPLASMGAAETLGSFLKWGVTNYPADKYMCLLWDHGGGSVAGIAVDELNGGDMLDLKELAEGIGMAGVQFELVGFDACLMSTLETAAAITPYARYMVASQELEPGTGWDYTDWLSYLANEPTSDGLAVGSRICDGFYAKCATGGTESMATLAVTDLSKIPALVAAFNNMAAEMKGYTAETDMLRPLTQAIMKAENYGGNNDTEGYTNMVDLGDLTRNAEGVLTETADELLNALKAAVPHSVAGEARQKGNGLSIYMPLAMTPEEMNRYAELAATSGEYLRFLEGLYDWKVPSGVKINQPIYPTQADTATGEQIAVDSVASAETLNRDNYEVKSYIELTEDGSILLTMQSGAEIISTVAFQLYYHDEESDSLWYLGSDFDVNQDDMGTRFWDNYRNVWTTINGNLCMMLALNFTDDYILYTVPVQVNGNATNLRMLYHRDSGEYEVIGTWDGIDSETGMASREVKKLKDGDLVEFVFDAAKMGTGEDASFVGGGFTVNGPVVAEEATLFDGDYYYQYEITDIFGNTHQSDFAVLHNKNGEISVELLAP